MKLHSALPKEGLFSVEDSTGKRRWVNIGHKVDGMTVEGYNSQNNTLILANGQKYQSIGLQGGTVFDSNAPTKESVVGAGTMSTQEQSLANQMGMKGAISDKDQREIDAAKSAANQSDYNVDPKWAEKTRQNFMQGEYFRNNPQIKGVHTLEEYKALEAEGGLADGIHMVMKNEKDGIGLDYFYHGKDAGTPANPPVQTPAPSFGSEILKGAKQAVEGAGAGAMGFAQDPSSGIRALGTAPLTGMAGIYDLITKPEKK
jgi:hypothetical protein